MVKQLHYSSEPVKTTKTKQDKERWSMAELWMNSERLDRQYIGRWGWSFPKPLMKSGRNLYFKRVEIEQWMKDNPAYVKNDYLQELA